MRVLNSRQMREADRRTIEDIGVPAPVLMENAGRQVVAAMVTAFPELPAMRVAVLCGRGNNGGDGFVVARALLERGVEAGVYLLGRADQVRGDARTNLDVLRRIGGDVVELTGAATWEIHAADVLSADVIVDALFGTGFTLPAPPEVETIITDVNNCTRPVIAVDLPSGLSADTADVAGPAMQASLTVTFGAPKVPLVLPPAELLAGRLVVADIGIPAPVIAALDGPRIELLTRESVRPLVEPRPPDSHKGHYGHVVVVGGSRGRTGAAYLAAMGALRSGAGLVTLATPASCQPVVAALGAEFMTEALPEGESGTLAWEALDRVLALDADVLVVGPGLGRSPSSDAFVHGLVERSHVPLVIDADALNAFAGEPDRLVARDGVDMILTPHPGEMARLIGRTVPDVQARRLDVAREFAEAHRLHVILKGHRTVVAAPNGHLAINTTGNPGMATAGSGDVLAGMAGAWLGQLLDPDAAAAIAVFVHGRAGDLAKEREGEAALIASDLLARLGEATRELTGGAAPAELRP